MNKPTFLEVRDVLDYDPESGVFLWRGGRGNRARIGTVAGRAAPGRHRQISIKGQRYQAHHLAWLLVHGSWPTQLVDHANGNPDDNRICNIRQCTHSLNAANSRPRSDSQTGVKGVAKSNTCERFEAYIRVGGQRRYLGLYKTVEEAALVAERARAAAFGDFAYERREAVA